MLTNLTHMLRSEQIFKDCAGMVVGRFQQTYKWEFRLTIIFQVFNNASSEHKLTAPCWGGVP